MHEALPFMGTSGEWIVKDYPTTTLDATTFVKYTPPVTFLDCLTITASGAEIASASGDSDCPPTGVERVGRWSFATPEHRRTLCCRTHRCSRARPNCRLSSGRLRVTPLRLSISGRRECFTCRPTVAAGRRGLEIGLATSFPSGRDHWTITC